MAEAIYTLPESPEPAASVAQPEGLYTHNDAMSAEAQARLIEFFKTPRWKELLAILVDEVQELEDAQWLMHTGFDLDTAEGRALDIIGRDVGELRNDRDDEAYRTAIRVRILVNESDGKLEQLIAIIAMADPTLDSEARERYPAGILFRWLGTFPALGPAVIMRLLQQAKAGGVRVQAVVRNPTTGFRWGTVAAAGAATPLCFSKVNKTGGGLIEAVY